MELEYRDSGGEITRSICFGMFVFGLRPILILYLNVCYTLGGPLSWIMQQ